MFVSAFEQVSQTLADRVDEHERKLAQVIPSGSRPISTKAINSISPSNVGQVSVQELQESVANLASSRVGEAIAQSSYNGSSDPVSGYTMPQHSVDRLDRSKIVFESFPCSAEATTFEARQSRNGCISEKL